jgi:hypothetical protein
VSSEMTNPRSASRGNFAIYFLAALGSLLIVAALAWFLYARTRPDTLNAARIAERIKDRREIEAAAAEALNNFGWADQSKGVVRLPITNAMELVVREWKNPAAGRSNLLARLERANPPPPPKAPEKPSVFE